MLILSLINYYFVPKPRKVAMENPLKRGFQKWLAQALGITEPLISMIINEKRTISIDIARRLTKQFPETNISHWLDMPILQIEPCLWELGKKEYIASLMQTKTEKEKTDEQEFIRRHKD